MKKPDKEKIFSDSFLRQTRKMTYVEFVRYMRWYTFDSRSYLLSKIASAQHRKSKETLDDG